MKTAEIITTIIHLSLKEYYQFKAIAKKFAIKFMIEEVETESISISANTNDLFILGYIELDEQ
jgi:hypothetical protein